MGNVMRKVGGNVVERLDVFLATNLNQMQARWEMEIGIVAWIIQMMVELWAPTARNAFRALKNVSRPVVAMMLVVIMQIVVLMHAPRFRLDRKKVRREHHAFRLCRKRLTRGVAVV